MQAWRMCSSGSSASGELYVDWLQAQFSRVHEGKDQFLIAAKKVWCHLEGQ
jgi:hypothetical protein